MSYDILRCYCNRYADSDNPAVKETNKKIRGIQESYIDENPTIKWLKDTYIMDPTITKREAVIKVGNITSPGTVMFDYDNWGTDGAKERSARYCEDKLYPKLKALLERIPLREGRHQALMNFITYMAALTWPNTQIYIYSERDAQIWLAPWFQIKDRAIKRKINSMVNRFFGNSKMNTDTMAKQTKQTQKLVCGVGINDLNEAISKNGNNLKFYSTWVSMLQRCYSEKYQAKQPTYVGCSVCNEWLSLSTFRIWFDANYRDGMSLDKDIIAQGNKVYSPETCRFVPHYINSLMTDAGAIRGELPLGITAQKPNPKTGRVNTTYEARCSDGNGKSLRKTFKTVAEARQWYSMTKKRVVNEQAIHAFEAGDINGDVYQALITREW